MANITIGNLRDMWKNVSDWATGSNGLFRPKIKIEDDDGNALKVNPDGSTNVQLTGSLMTHYGVTIAQRPAANTVPIGATFELVGSDDVWQSNGTEWVVL